jgi:hypothetical protein
VLSSLLLPSIVRRDLKSGWKRPSISPLASSLYIELSTLDTGSEKVRGEGMRDKEIAGEWWKVRGEAHQAFHQLEIELSPPRRLFLTAVGTVMVEGKSSQRVREDI